MLPIQDRFQEYVDSVMAKGDRHPVIRLPANLQVGFCFTVCCPADRLTIEIPGGCKISAAKLEKP